MILPIQFTSEICLEVQTSGVAQLREDAVFQRKKTLSFNQIIYLVYCIVLHIRFVLGMIIFFSY